ncbi:MAG: hypothetical protein VX585_04010 [Pseudomonadota bacterium]|nr:hypothetical protein [Pseudomonadota bacterium]
MLDTFIKALKTIVEAGTLVIAMAVVLQIVADDPVPILKMDVVAGITGLIGSLDDEGLASLVALAIFVWFFRKKSS